jgi:hypothetical protein
LVQTDDVEEEDELRKEQSEVPPEEFEQQPSALDAAWEAAGQVADKAKRLIVDEKTEE